LIDPLVRRPPTPVPKSAILPLMLLSLRVGEASKVANGGARRVLPDDHNTTAGVLEIDKIYLDVGKNFGPAAGMPFARSRCPPAPLIMAA